MLTVQAVPFRRGIVIRCFILYGKVWLYGDDCAYALRFSEPYLYLLSICPSCATLGSLTKDYAPFLARDEVIQKADLRVLAQYSIAPWAKKLVGEWLDLFPTLAAKAEADGVVYPPPSEYLHVRELSRLLNVSTSSAVNRWLEDEKYQYRDGTEWGATKAGSEICIVDANPTHPSYRLRWNAEVIKRRFNSSRRVGA